MTDRNLDAGFGSHHDMEQAGLVDLLDLIANERDDAREHLADAQAFRKSGQSGGVTWHVKQALKCRAAANEARRCAANYK